MNYFYFNPFSKQYLFPTGFKQYELFTTFYQPYTFKGKVLWWLWCNVSMFRKLCQVTKPEEIVPIVQLERHINKDTILAFNRGTTGIEQKTSVLGVDLKTKNEFFIKYANTVVSRKNVINEGEILKQLAALDFVPQLIQHLNEKEFIFIQTSVLKGERVVNQNIEQQLLSVLCKMAELKVVTKNECNTELKTCFSHGDFCPWNMMLHNNELQIFDWEMGGIQPVGYDLFTYIFQPSFLLTPSKINSLIIEENKSLITSYFKSQKIEDWKPYLFEFTTIKLNLELEKISKNLLPLYKELNDYAQKN
jgi:tRNA A-37 threonylcarbamoyl transferase component Bud32